MRISYWSSDVCSSDLKGLRYACDFERRRKLHCEEAFCLVDEKPPVALRLGQERFSSVGSDREGLAHQNFSTPQQLLKRGSFERLEDQDRCAGLNGVVELVGRVLCCGADQDDYARLYRSQQQVLNRLRHPMNFIDEKSGSFAGLDRKSGV